ncbi:hypothetical protein ASD16_08610 [Cellulomonas sp. Root485]|uniref:hypothetical protein n=1 Tax=Cellulomonas sp. Root485 TaxID=1736546 RepID=UPI0006FAA3CF|nr:hypothetical protein [Cellulomonas sp. Root485]KQY25451.1 hypothetical protein ASD16_08610 [Cellulomonas sp. Root485]
MPSASSLFAHADDGVFYVGRERFGPTSVTVTPTHITAVTEDGTRHDYALSGVFQASVTSTFDHRRLVVRRWSSVLLVTTDLFGGPTTLYTYRGRFLTYLLGLGPSDVGGTLGELAPEKPPRWWVRAVSQTFEQYGYAQRLRILALESTGVIADIESCRSWSGAVASRRAAKAARARIRAAR